ncbi:hypothetical protein [Hymenobacter aerophilus]|uniref:hypothetical protein n=1 Tax=Hymenobacter aerophilus TaxID=119644 RepID=UPI00037FB806|nr:hypothetical protein [Hymenobacter aerophilus]
MGFEHELSFAPPLDFPTLQRLLTCLKRPPTWPLLRAEQDGQTHVLGYAYAAGVLPVWEEDFLLCLTNQKLYLLLHTVTGEQEQAVLAWLQDCLHTSGLATVEFHEP